MKRKENERNSIVNLLNLILGASGDSFNGSSKIFVSKLTSPPYRMPPQPPGLCGEVPIPGAASDPPLRTHSSKFPVSKVDEIFVQFETF